MANLILYSANIILNNCKFLRHWEEVIEVRDKVPVSQVHEKTQGAYVRATLSRGNWVVVIVNCMLPMVVEYVLLWAKLQSLQLKAIGCSSLREGGGELDTIKNLNL